MKAGLLILTSGLATVGFAYGYYGLPSGSIFLVGGGSLLVVGGLNRIFAALFEGQL